MVLGGVFAFEDALRDAAVGGGHPFVAFIEEFFCFGAEFGVMGGAACSQAKQRDDGDESKVFHLEDGVGLCRFEAGPECADEAVFGLLTRGQSLE